MSPHSSVLITAGFAFAALFQACQAKEPSTATKDIVTDLDREGTGPTWIYFQEGGDRLIRLHCNDPEVLTPMREDCTGERQEVSATRFFAELGKDVGKEFDPTEERIQQFFVKLSQIDQQMNALLPDDEHSGVTDLRDALDNAEVVLGDVNVELFEINREIRLIRRQLRLEENETAREDLENQVAALLSQRVNKTQEKTEKEVALREARTQLVALLSELIDDEIFQDLEEQRDIVEEKLLTERNKRDEIIEEEAQFLRVRKLVGREQTFDVREEFATLSGKKFVAAFHQTFLKVLPAEVMVAFFASPEFTYTGDDIGSEQPGNALLSVLKDFGFSVTTFTAHTGAEFRRQLENAKVLVIPSLRKDFSEVMNRTLTEAIKSFARRGGVVFIPFGGFGELQLKTIAKLYSLGDTVWPAVGSLSLTQEGVDHADQPSPDLSVNRSVLPARLAVPLTTNCLESAEAYAIYRDENGAGCVVYRHERGTFLHFGWNFFAADTPTEDTKPWLKMLRDVLMTTTGTVQPNSMIFNR